MKSKVLTAIKTVVFLLILALCFAKAVSVLERKTAEIKYAPFFEQKEDYDVLFIGSSHVVNGFFPMELWKDYGIVSYNFGGHGNQMGTNYWVMMNALDYTTPKLMIIDVFGVHYQGKRSATAEQMHEAFDAFPLSKTKYEMVLDLFEEDDEAYASRWEYFWSFGKYHSRWSDLKKEDFDPKMNLEKGAEVRIDVAVPGDYPICSRDQVMENPDTVGMEYLRKMIEECQSRGIEVLLTHLPYPAETDWQKAANAVYEVAEHYGVDYINFVEMNNVVDYQIDCYDVSSHLNPSGGRKVTDYLGNYLVTRYGMPDRRGDEAYAQWHRDFAAYDAYMKEKMGELNELEDILMFLRDSGLSAQIYISAETGRLQNPLTHKLLDNVRDGDTLSRLAEATLENQDYMMIVNCADWTTTEVVLDGETAEFAEFLKPQIEGGKVLVKVVVYDSVTGEIIKEFSEER